MPVNSVHPKYQQAFRRWELMRDSMEGESAIKALGPKYLPPTPSQILDGMKPGLYSPEGCKDTNNLGLVSYHNYVSRAHYPDFFKEGVRTVLGILNAKPARVVMPKQMEYLLTNATPNGQSLETLLRLIHLEQLVVGRIGLLADFKTPKTPGEERPYIAPYLTETITNWDAGEHVNGQHKMNLIVLNECGKVRNGFEWEDAKKWRVLRLSGATESTDEASGVYQFATTEDAGADLNELAFTPANIQGRNLEELPFVCIGPTDLDPNPDEPPLDGLAELCLLIYRGEADYRYTLFMQGQETLVISGSVVQRELSQDGTGKQAPIRVGADSAIELTTGGTAEYIGISSSGLPEQRSALEADRNRAAVKTGQLLQPGKASMESGEALKTRVAAQTATLTSVAKAGAEGLQTILRVIAKWMGLNPEEVSVTPNLDFTNFHIQGQDIVQLITAKRLGAPLSMKSIHDIMRERGLTRLDWEQELEEIRKDPEELVKFLLQDSADTGNNPTASAGGPQKSTQGQRRQTSVPRDQQGNDA